MAMEDLPRNFDAIILGTGMPESILAASLARIGMKVLHLDRNDYYSGGWATLNWVGLHQWIKRNQDQDTSPTTESIGSQNEVYQYDDAQDASLITERESLVRLPLNTNHYTNVKASFHCPERSPTPPTPTLIKTSVAGQDGFTPHSDNDSVFPNEDQLDVVVEAGSNKEVTYSNRVRPESPSSISCPKTADLRDKKISLNDDDMEDEREEEVTDEAAEEEKTLQGKIEDQWTQERLTKEWRRFNIDLSPKLLLSRGSMVDLLVSSDIAKYADHRVVSRVLTRQNAELKQVPCCRADVFNSKEVSVLEKRLLMKFLTFCVDFDIEAKENRSLCILPFEEFLVKNQKLTPVLKNYVINAIAMVPANANTRDGLKRVQTFLHSLGRYGNTPYLWTLYGSGELPQCFCRMCAVFGGIYILRKTARSLIIEASPESSLNRVKGVICTGGMRFSTKWLIAESSYAPEDWIKYSDSASSPSQISRGVYMTDASILPTEDGRDHVTLLNLPAEDWEANRHPTSVLELGHTSMVSPKGLFLVHVTRPQATDALNDFKPVEKTLFRKEDVSTKPLVLWTLHFNAVDTSGVRIRPESAPGNFLVTSGPGAALDYDAAVAQARSLFQVIAPDRSAEEFLPPAPNPEDIYVEDVEPPAQNPVVLENSEEQARPVVVENPPESEQSLEEGMNALQESFINDHSVPVVADYNRRESQSEDDSMPAASGHSNCSIAPEQPMEVDTETATNAEAIERLTETEG